jgi:precorrin-6B methylase 2
MVDRNKGLAILTAFVICLVLAGGIAAEAQEYQPSVGQEGKDVIWVPTPPELVQEMLDMAKLTPSDFLVDLGSGDGRIVIAAAKRGARAMGVEFNPEMAALSKRTAEKEGVSAKATFVNGDIFVTDFSKATVLTMYLLPSLNMKLRPKILEMKPGTRVVAHAFDMEDWLPDQTEMVSERRAFLWIVPAKVAGVWTSPNGELKLTQKFQALEGTLKGSPLRDGKMNGTQITFQVAETQYSGSVSGNTIVGTVKRGTGPEVKWTATRSAAK